MRLIALLSIGLAGLLQTIDGQSLDLNLSPAALTESGKEDKKLNNKNSDDGEPKQPSAPEPVDANEENSEPIQDSIEPQESLPSPAAYATVNPVMQIPTSNNQTKPSQMKPVDESNGGMDTGALVGMILGVIGGLLLLAGLIAFWIIRRRKAASKKDSKLSKPVSALRQVVVTGGPKPPGKTNSVQPPLTAITKEKQEKPRGLTQKSSKVNFTGAANKIKEVGPVPAQVPQISTAPIPLADLGKQKTLPPTPKMHPSLASFQSCSPAGVDKIAAIEFPGASASDKGSIDGRVRLALENMKKNQELQERLKEQEKHAENMKKLKHNPRPKSKEELKRMSLSDQDLRAKNRSSFHLPLLEFEDDENPIESESDMSPILSKRLETTKTKFDDALQVKSSPRVLMTETGGPFVDDKVREILERARKVKRHELVKSNSQRKNQGSMENTPLLQKANKSESEENFVLPDLPRMDDTMTREVLSSPSISAVPFVNAQQKAYDSARSNTRKYPGYKYLSAPEYGLPSQNDSASAILLQDDDASTELADALVGGSSNKRPSPNAERLAYLKQRTQSFDSLLNNGSIASKQHESHPEERHISQSMETMKVNYERLMEDHRHDVNRPLEGKDVL